MKTIEKIVQEKARCSMQPVSDDAKIEAAIQLFREGKVTLGRAAEIAGLTRWEFDTLLADRGIGQIIECDSAENLEAQGQTHLMEG
jgi:predicted HTH domain antitoxin